MSVMADVMVTRASEARDGTWGRLSLGSLMPNLAANLIAEPLLIEEDCNHEVSESSRAMCRCRSLEPSSLRSSSER